MKKNKLEYYDINSYQRKAAKRSILQANHETLNHEKLNNAKKMIVKQENEINELKEKLKQKNEAIAQIKP